MATSIGAVGGLFQSGSKFGATELGANFNRTLISEYSEDRRTLPHIIVSLSPLDISQSCCTNTMLASTSSSTRCIAISRSRNSPSADELIDANHLGGSPFLSWRITEP